MFRTVFFYLFIFFQLISCNSGQQENPSKSVDMSTFDWQGHRGARGLMPENSIEGFIKALEYPVTTLELDVVISKDQQVVLSHEPWFGETICLKPDGEEIAKKEAEELLIYQMTYDEIKAFDCGSKPHSDFPDQQKMKVTKPTLQMVVNAVERYCERMKREKPQYNIELKSDPKWDNNRTPPPAEFARLVLDELDRLLITDRTIIQCFDPRVLQEVHQRKPDLTTALLITNIKSIKNNVNNLGYTPEIYSPNHRLLNARRVAKIHDMGMKVIPWTINEKDRMIELIEMGVDGIITDYPNLISDVVKHFSPE